MQVVSDAILDDWVARMLMRRCKMAPRWLQNRSKKLRRGFQNQSRSLSHGSQQSKNAFPAVRLSNSQFIVHNQHITQSSKTNYIELKNKSRPVFPPLLQAEKTLKIAILVSTRNEPLKTILNS